MQKKVTKILSGIRPTGRLHIGNYLGSVKNFIALQGSHESYFFIADLHSLNEPYDPKDKYAQIINLAKDYLAAGLDPQRCTLFVQSHVPQHTELSVILASIIPASFLFRMTQYKEKSTDREQDSVNAGLLYYPVLMAADILLYKPSHVPVGQDQTQHVELARDAAGFFNNRFGITFPEPQPLYTETPKIMGLQHPEKKMSKSFGEQDCIFIDETPEMILKKLSRAVTDSGDASSAGGSNLLGLMKIFNPELFLMFADDANHGKLKYGELKKQLAETMGAYFADFRERKATLTDEYVQDVLATGAAKAADVAGHTLEEVRRKIGIRP